MSPRYPGHEADPDKLRRHFAHSPATTLPTVDLVREARHWEKVLAELIEREAARSTDWAAEGARWAGMAVAAVSIPAVFASPVIGLPLALIGAISVGVGEWRRREARALDALYRVRLSVLDERRRELRDELDRRLLPPTAGSAGSGPV